MSENRYYEPMAASDEPDHMAPAGEEDAWPGVAPPAGWFLLPQAGAGAPAMDVPDSPATDDAGYSVTGAWFTPPAPDPDESPISWCQDLDGAEEDEEPSGPAAEEPGEPAAGQAEPVSGPAQSAVSVAELDVGPTRARWGKAGGPGFHPGRLGPAPGAAAKRAAADRSPWQRSQRLWSESDVRWDHGAADGAPLPPASAPERSPSQEPDAAPLSPRGNPPQSAPPLPPAPLPPHNTHAVNGHARPWPFPPEPVNDASSRQPHVLLSAPVFAGTGIEPGASPETQPPAGQDLQPAGHRPAPPWDRPYDQAPPLSAGNRAKASDTALLEPEQPYGWQPDARHGLLSRHAATIAVPVIVLVAVAVLALALLTGHGPKFGQLTSNQRGNSQPGHGTGAQSSLTIGMYPGQQQRGVFQTINRVVASGNTVVTMGSQTSDGVARQQFFVSTNGGASWRLAPVQTPGGGQVPVGYAAARLAGGPGGWVAVGPQAIWTSPDGQSWTLAASHGITPQAPGDQVWVLTSTAQGYLAAGATGGRASQAVIWTSRDGLTWQRKTAAQLGLAGPGETVQNISYATWRGDDTVISGEVAKDGTTYFGVWLSTDGGSAWTRVTVPVDHGAGNWISGLGSDGSGLIAVRPGRSASGADDGVAYFSPNGQAWQYSATVDPAGGWSPSLVKGSDYGFVVTGASATGQILAYTSTGTGTAWQSTAPLGDAAAESVVGATVGSAGTIIAIGYTAASKVSQQPVFLEASPGGSVRSVSLAGIDGATIPELAVNGLAISGGQQVAVGSVNGFPAVWRKAPGGSWALASSLSQVAADQGLSALTGVTRGPAGWLAVGAPGPVVFTSADGARWQPATGAGSITDDLAGVSAVATAAGPAGYVIVGKLVASGGSCVADVWWSANLTSWTRAHDVNDVTGSSQVLAVAADAHGFVSVGSHDGKPAVWTTTDGRSWTTIVLPVPAGASAAVLQQIAIDGNRVAALGQETTAAGSVPFAELSVNGGASWSQVPFSTPGPDTTFTALTAGPGGFTAAGQFGQQGRLQVGIWTSANGTTWVPSHVSGLTGPEAGGSYQVAALAPSGSAVTAIGSIATQQSQEVFTVTLPAR